MLRLVTFVTYCNIGEGAGNGGGLVTPLFISTYVISSLGISFALYLV